MRWEVCMVIPMRRFRYAIEPLESRIAPAVFIVTTINDTTDPAHNTGSLRDAVLAASALGGKNTIVFHLPPPAGHQGNVIHLSGGIPSTGNLNIVGPGDSLLTIDAGGAGRIFDIQHTGSTDAPTTISGLTLVNGNIGGGGGAIYSDVSLTLKNVVISGSTAAGNGGGLAVHGTTNFKVGATISGCTFTNDTSTGTATDGGAIELLNVASATISGTTVSGDTATFRGGGIYLSINSLGSNALISGCQVSGNGAAYGGGIATSNGNAAGLVTISGTKVEANISTGQGQPLGGGGGILMGSGNDLITGCAIVNNTAEFNGGGIKSANATSFTLASSAVTGNSTTTTSTTTHQGGGGLTISSTSGAVKILKSQVTGNRSARDGGGVYATKNLSIAITGSTFSGNLGNRGGALFTYDASAGTAINITGSTFSGNLAGSGGGGIYTINAGAITISSSKITGNTAAFGSGGGMVASGPQSLSLVNTVIASNTAVVAAGGLFVSSTTMHMTGGAVTGNAVTNGVYSGFGGGVVLTGVNASILGVTISGNSSITGGGLFNINSNGTPAGPVTIQAALVTGNTAQTDPNLYGLNITLVGPAAPAPHNASGAFVVTTTADVVNPTDGVTSLREALAAADANPASVDTITFNLPASQLVDGAWTIKLNGTPLTTLGNVHIIGPGAGRVILDGGGSSTILNINDTSSSANHPVTISGLSFVDGKGAVGGAVYSTESLALQNVTISNNTATTLGGGVFVSGNSALFLPSLAVSGSVIAGNTAAFAGGIGLINGKSLTVTSSIVTGNTASGNGGGIAFNSSVGTQVAISNSRISYNSGAAGGGLFIVGQNTQATPSITITGAVITSNISNSAGPGANGGGGIYLKVNGKTTITGSTISGNFAQDRAGGLYVSPYFASLAISSSVFSGNQTGVATEAYGGGAAIRVNGNTNGTHPPVTITGSQFSANKSLGQGGAISVEGGLGLNVVTSTFSGNTSSNGGGAIYGYGFTLATPNIAISGAVFAGNKAALDGGAIAVHDIGSLTLATSHVTGNTSFAGGGIYARADSAAVSMNNDIVSANTAFAGGGIELYGIAAFHVSGGAFTANSASDSILPAEGGGGLYINNSTGSILGVTISGNSALGTGGGIFNGGTNPGHVTVQIARVIGNSAAFGPNIGDSTGNLSTFTLV